MFEDIHSIYLEKKITNLFKAEKEANVCKNCII